jgi:outer membrane receptor protein involved in Fe transport
MKIEYVARQGVVTMKYRVSVVSICLMLSLAAPAVWSQTAQDSSKKDSPSDSKPGAETRNLSQGALTAYTLPDTTITVYGVVDQTPAVPVISRLGNEFNTVTEEQIERQGALDFYDALRNVPGVMYQKKNIIGGQTSHSLYIRGRGASHPSPDLNILFDDVPRSGVLYGQALADGIPVYALGGMEIYKSPQPARFGSGYGMINFIPKYMVEDGYAGSANFEGGSYGTIAENVAGGLKKGKFDIYAAQDWITTDGHVAHSAGRQASYYMNLGFQISDHWTIRALGNYVDARTEVPNNPLTGTRATDRYDTITGLTTVTLGNRFGNASGFVKIYYNDTSFYIRGESNGTAQSKQSNTLYGLRGRETFSIWEKGELVTGFDLDRTELQNYNISYTSPLGPNNPRTWNFPDQTIFSPYVAINQLLGSQNGLHVIPSAGIRFSHNTVFADKAAPQAGMILGYKNTDLNLNYSRGVNYPSPVVLQNFLPNKDLPAGFDTNKIKPEIVDHYEAGLTHTLAGAFTLGGTYFYDRGKDRTRAYMYGAVDPNELFFNSTTSRYRIQGFELAGSLTPAESLKIFGGATWLRAKGTGDDGVERNTMPYTPAFTFQAGFNWDFLRRLHLSGDYQHFQDMYAGTAARTSATNSPASNFPALTSINLLPDADVVNFRVDYNFALRSRYLEKAKLFLGVDNALNSRCAYALETNSSGNKGYYYMPGTTFSVGINLGF